MKKVSETVLLIWLAASMLLSGCDPSDPVTIQAIDTAVKNSQIFLNTAGGEVQIIAITYMKNRTADVYLTQIAGNRLVSIGQINRQILGEVYNLMQNTYGWHKAAYSAVPAATQTMVETRLFGISRSLTMGTAGSLNAQLALMGIAFQSVNSTYQLSLLCERMSAEEYRALPASEKNRCIEVIQ